MSFNVTVLTLFPQIFPGTLGLSVIGDALQRKIWTLNTVNIRDFATDKHHKVDSPGFGGGPGMVLRPDVIDYAMMSVTNRVGPDTKRIYLSPRGTLWSQSLCQEWVKEEKHLIFLCGRFEGVDQRALELWEFEEISLGDGILSGGEVAAMALIECCIRLLNGVLGDSQSLKEESFSSHLLEYPHYTYPRIWKDKPVPNVLVSGHHAHIRRWRLEQSQAITQSRRPGLWALYQESKENL